LGSLENVTDLSSSHNVFARRHRRVRHWDDSATLSQAQALGIEVNSLRDSAVLDDFTWQPVGLDLGEAGNASLVNEALGWHCQSVVSRLP
jgi:hypothetical protein